MPETTNTLDLDPCNFNSLIFAPRLQNTYTFPTPRSNTHAQKSRRWTEPHPLGLWNSGQSCHLGASLTALSAVPLLRAHLVRRQPRATDTCFALLRTYVLEGKADAKHRRALDPRPVLAMLEKEGWKSRHAQDACETMARLIEILEGGMIPGVENRGVGIVGMGKERNGCFGRAGRVEVGMKERMRRGLFSGLFWLRRVCEGCKHDSGVKFEENFMVSIPVTEGGGVIGEVIRRVVTGGERVEMRCEGCGMIEWHRWIRGVKQCPEILVVHLQRAVYCGRRGVGIGEGGVWVGGVVKVGGVSYKVRSVVRHSGGTGRGSHFDCVVGEECGECEFGLPGIGGKWRWWVVDDDMVRRCEGGVGVCSKGAYVVICDQKKKVENTREQRKSCVE